MSKKEDPYRVLQVSRDAEKEVIDAAYRSLARKYHPDVNSSPDAPIKMQALNWAYEVVGNPEARQTWDRAHPSQRIGFAEEQQKREEQAEAERHRSEEERKRRERAETEGRHAAEGQKRRKTADHSHQAAGEPARSVTQNGSGSRMWIVFGVIALFALGALATGGVFNPAAQPAAKIAPMPATTTTPTEESIATLMLRPTSIGTAEPPSGATKISEKDGMITAFVPAGSFEMGSNDGTDDEKPVRTVTLDAFWIDRTEVTHSQYEKCVSAGVCQPSRYKDDSRFNGRQQPVVGVNWDDANAYCQWAGRRLPSEAEWEFAARGTDRRTYPWGSQQPDKNKTNYNNNSGNTTEVGSYPDGASPYGAQDMAGNVWEWVVDWYGPYPSNPQANPTGPSTVKSRVLRGGSWVGNGYDIRSTNRGWNDPSDTNTSIGFRCASSS